MLKKGRQSYYKTNSNLSKGWGKLYIGLKEWDSMVEPTFGTTFWESHPLKMYTLTLILDNANFTLIGIGFTIILIVWSMAWLTWSYALLIIFIIHSSLYSQSYNGSNLYYSKILKNAIHYKDVHFKRLRFSIGMPTIYRVLLFQLRNSQIRGLEDLRSRLSFFASLSFHLTLLQPTKKW